MVFDSGWYVDATSTATPDGLEMALDKKHYAAGSSAHLRISPRFAGKALVVVGANRLLWQQTVALSQDGTDVTIPLSRNWGTGVYVTVFAYRAGGGASAHMPARAIGVQWLSIDPDRYRLELTLGAEKRVRPGRLLQIPLMVNGPKAGEQVYATVAAVDVGILNLTGFKAPQPESWYFGQRSLGLQIKDLYGKLIDGFAGASGRIRSGGDGSVVRQRHDVPRQKPLALFSGVVTIAADGQALVQFAIPQFTGSLRIMAVAWSSQAVGHAVQDVVVRDPVVILASLPKFLAPGDHSRLQLSLDNQEGPAGDYHMQITGSQFVTVDEVSEKQSITLGAGEKRILSVPIQALQSGMGQLRLRLTRPDAEVYQQQLQLPVRSPQLQGSKRSIQRLHAQGGSLVIDRHTIDGLVPDSARVSVLVQRIAGLDVISLLQALDRYPYGCAEQTTSRALPLLYWSDLATEAGLGDGEKIHQRVQKAIGRLGSYQSAAGSFGMWGPGSDNLWLDAYVTDFLSRAREAGFIVPEEVLKLALQNLQNSVSYDYALKNRGNDIVYALYVLARNKRAAIGDLRYIAEARLEDIVSPLARAQLAASLGFYGDIQRSQKVFVKAYAALEKSREKKFVRDDYGSALRDQAAVLALAAEAHPVPSFVPKLAQRVALSRLEKRITSTQENAWLTLAARALLSDNKSVTLQANGLSRQGDYRAELDANTLTTGLKLINSSTFPVEAVVTVTGVSSKPLQAAGKGLSITRDYYDLQGHVVDPSRVVQNTRLLVVLRSKVDSYLKSRIVIRDLLPAGLEIVSPHLFSSADLKQFRWLKTTAVTHSEFRDDRFVAAVHRQTEDGPVITLAYMVRAISPGTYVQPAAVVEDMYRPYLAAHTAQGTMTVVPPGSE